MLAEGKLRAGRNAVGSCARHAVHVHTARLGGALPGRVATGTAAPSTSCIGWPLRLPERAMRQRDWQGQLLGSALLQSMLTHSIV